MKRRRDRQLASERLVLGTLGVVVTSAAVLGLLVSGGVIDFGTTRFDASQPLVTSTSDGDVVSHAVWWQLGAVGAGMVLVGLGAWWLRRQVPPSTCHHPQVLPNTDEHIKGTNLIDGRALAAALSADIEQHPEVGRVVAEIRSAEGVIRLRVAAADTFAVSKLCSEVIAPAVRRAAVAGAFDRPISTQIDVRFHEPKRNLAESCTARRRTTTAIAVQNRKVESHMSDHESGPKAAVSGIVEDLKGKAKEVIGNVTDNASLKDEGKAQQEKASAERDVAAKEAEAEKSRAQADIAEGAQRAAPSDG